MKAFALVVLQISCMILRLTHTNLKKKIEKWYEFLKEYKENFGYAHRATTLPEHFRIDLRHFCMQL